MVAKNRVKRFAAQTREGNWEGVGVNRHAGTSGMRKPRLTPSADKATARPITSNWALKTTAQ